MQLVFLPALICSLHMSTIDIVILSSLGYMPAYNMYVNVNHLCYTVLSFEDDMTFYRNTYTNVCTTYTQNYIELISCQRFGAYKENFKLV